ncbi:cell division protein FtsZ [Thermocrinis albus DSM 14484]|uniref:Cell division protein FtsZ n=1 Tax=Thermocrinis albus (strain DSM 14484 / JCM 11386 / HI 11/12) TaxID=638303 RepID=D3SPD2_THEAH|nr:cell division protein FtsZ [Thermocrinis albus]ADC89019.1 cell division protein FtsZ [Thermocrinis albus DSM 14484]
MQGLNPTRIKVFGVGGGGSNAVNRMYLDGIEGVELYAINTDVQHLTSLAVPNRIQIGEKVTRGLGAGAKPEIGEQAALEDIDRIKEVLRGTDMLFLAVGLGGGTGTGAAPVIAEAAKEMGILTVAVVTKPFHFEGPKRMQTALEGLERLKDVVDTYIVINNQKLVELADRNFSIKDAFRLVDEVLSKAVRGITNIVVTPALINVDFADVRTVMEKGGLALIGMGEARGDGKRETAIEQAVSSPLLEGNTVEGARRLLVTLWVSEDVPFRDVEEAITRIREAAHEDALIIFGAVLEEGKENFMRVAVVATDFEGAKEQSQFKVVKKEQKDLKKVVPETPIEPVQPEVEDIPAYLRRKKKL